MMAMKVGSIFLLVFVCAKAELRDGADDDILLQDEYVLDDNYGNTVDLIKKRSGKSVHPTKFVLNTEDKDIELVIVEKKNSKKPEDVQEVDLLRLLNNPSCKFTSQAARTLHDGTITVLSLVCQGNASGKNNLVRERAKLHNFVINENDRVGHRYRKDSKFVNFNAHLNMLRSRHSSRESEKNQDSNTKNSGKKDSVLSLGPNYNSYDAFNIRNKLQKLLQNQEQNWENYETSTHNVNYVNPSNGPYVEYDSTPDPQLPSGNSSYVLPTVPYPPDNTPPNKYPVHLEHPVHHPPNHYQLNPVPPNPYQPHPNYYPKYPQYPPNCHPNNYPNHEYPVYPYKPYPPSHLLKPYYPGPHHPNHLNYYDDPFFMETTVYPQPEFYPFDPSYVNYYHKHHPRPKVDDFSNSEEEYNPHKTVKNRKRHQRSIQNRRSKHTIDVKKPRTAKEFRESPTKKQLILSKK